MKFYIGNEVAMSIMLAIVIAITSCSNSQTVLVTGKFPKEVEAYAELTVEKNGEKWRYSSPVREGQYEFELDSIETGIYDLKIEWSVPFEKRYRTKRGKTGELIKEYNPKGYWTYSLSKNIYINPDQSLQYHIKFEKDVSEEMIYELTEDTTNRTDLYRLQIVSESEDAQLFDRMDSLRVNYDGYAYSVILDSLFEASERTNKLYRDFSSLARKLNLNNNYAAYIDKKMTLVEENLDNPIGTLAVLNVDSRLMMADLDRYKRFLEDMGGRAKESPYYDSLVRKVNGLPVPLKKGDELPAPSGHRPDYKPISFESGDYRYSLVVFWTSWDEVSRQQNRTWNRLLDRYGNNGFQVLGLSLDDELNDWTDAIEREQLQRWFHLSDIGQGFAGDNAIRHGVQSIPFTILINQQGQIVEKDMSPSAVQAFLKQNL